MNDDELFSHFTLYRGVWIATTPHQSKKITREDATRLLKKGGLMVRNTYDFDCEEETEFWYVVKDAPFVFEDLSANSRKYVKKANRRCIVKLIDGLKNKEDLWNVYRTAYSRYKNPDNILSQKTFFEDIRMSNGEYYGAFCRESSVMAGWMYCERRDGYVEAMKAKFNPLFKHVRPSAALFYFVLDYYLNQKQIPYICTGTRCLNHKTNVQEYQFDKWHFRKAYCRLKVYYSPKIGGIVRMIYPFRRLLRCFDSVTFFHRVNGLLKMEEIARNARAVCFGSLAQRNVVSRENIRKFLNATPEDCLRICDINLRQQFYSKEVLEDSFCICNILKINDEELVVVNRMFGYDGLDMRQTCEKIVQDYHLKLLVLTCGTNGSYVFTDDGLTSFQDTPKVEVADTVGAGDSFTGSFCACIINGKPVQEAHKTAVQVSAFVCTQNGAMPIVPEKLKA